MPVRMCRIAVLDNVVEAQLLGAELTARGIPHLMRSYHDSAYDGIYQFMKGWGHVEGSADYQVEILEILHGLRHTPVDSEDDTGE